MYPAPSQTPVARDYSKPLRMHRQKNEDMFARLKDLARQLNAL